MSAQHHSQKGRVVDVRRKKEMSVWGSGDQRPRAGGHPNLDFILGVKGLLGGEKYPFCIQEKSS